jgi:hypothetical protein
MRVHVAAYACSASLDVSAETALYNGLADLGVAGLEQPFFGSLHRRDDAWLLDRLRPDWTFVFTLLPGVMDRLKDDPRFGLASADKDGRSRALDFAESARRTIEHLNGYLGRRAVIAVQLHSAPRLTNARSSVEAFADSLSQLRGRDWMDAALLVEHCDAVVSGRSPDKGFMNLEDELSAVKLSAGKTPIKFSINWGRSALETRSVQGPIDHIRRAVKGGQLGALFFSGVAAEHPDYGAWKDSHVPFSTSCPASLLTPAAVKAALAAAAHCPIYGLKLQTLPHTLDVPQRLAVIRDGLEQLRKLG